MGKGLKPHGWMQKDLEKTYSEDELSFDFEEGSGDVTNIDDTGVLLRKNPLLKDKVKERQEHMMLERRKKLSTDENIKKTIRRIIAKKQSKRPPKGWFYKVLKEVQRKSPDLSEEAARAVVGDMWYNEMDSKNKNKVKKEYRD